MLLDVLVLIDTTLTDKVVYAIDPVTIGIAAATVLSGMLGAASQDNANKQNIQAQYNVNRMNIDATRAANAQARAWANEDWERTNLYNSPTQQMQRLREAGLSPHLVYGKGADNTASMVARTDPKVPDLRAAKVDPLPVPDLGPVLGQMYDMERKKAETENLRQQNALLKQQGDINDLKMLGMITGNESKGFDLSLKKRLEDTTVSTMLAKKELTESEVTKQMLENKFIPLRFDLQRQELRLKQAKTNAEVESINKDIILKTFQARQLQPAQLERLRKEIDVLDKTGQLRQFDIDLRSVGLNPSDPSYVRAVVAAANKIMEHMGLVGDTPDLPANPMDFKNLNPNSILRYKGGW